MHDGFNLLILFSLSCGCRDVKLVHHTWDTGGAPAGDSKRPDVVCSDPTGEQKYIIDTKTN